MTWVAVVVDNFIFIYLFWSVERNFLTAVVFCAGLSKPKPVIDDYDDDDPEPETKSKKVVKPGAAKKVCNCSAFLLY